MQSQDSMCLRVLQKSLSKYQRYFPREDLKELRNLHRKLENLRRFHRFGMAHAIQKYTVGDSKTGAIQTESFYGMGTQPVYEWLLMGHGEHTAWLTGMKYYNNQRDAFKAGCKYVFLLYDLMFTSKIDRYFTGY